MKEIPTSTLTQWAENNEMVMNMETILEFGELNPNRIIFEEPMIVDLRSAETVLTILMGEKVVINR